MAFKVCKLVRLTKKNEKGEFEKNEKNSILVRSKAIVSEETIADSETSCAKTGLLYIVDEKLTKKRESELEAENVSYKAAEKINVVDENVEIGTAGDKNGAAGDKNDNL